MVICVWDTISLSLFAWNLPSNSISIDFNKLHEIFCNAPEWLLLNLHLLYFCFLFLMWALFDINTFPNDPKGNFIRLEKGLNKTPYFIEMHKNLPRVSPMANTAIMEFGCSSLLLFFLHIYSWLVIQRLKWTQNMFQPLQPWLICG